MIIDYAYIKPGNKSYHIIRTEHTFYDVTNRRVLAGGGVQGNNGGSVPDASRLSGSYVTKIVAKLVKATAKRSKIRRFQRKEAV